MQLKVGITREDYADFAKFHFMKTGFRKTIIYYVFLFIACLFIINLNKFGWTKTIIFSLAYFILVYFGINRWINKLKKTPLEDGSILGKTEYEFIDDGIVYKKHNSEGKVNWSIIKSFESDKNAYYLYIDTLVAFVIPKRIFNNNEEMTAFQNLVERNIQK